jgi:hypothetical protein
LSFSLPYFGFTGHAFEINFFSDDDAMTVCNICRNLICPVMTLVFNPALNFPDLRLGFPASSKSFNFPLLRLALPSVLLRELPDLILRLR